MNTDLPHVTSDNEILRQVRSSHQINMMCLPKALIRVMRFRNHQLYLRQFMAQHLRVFMLRTAMISIAFTTRHNTDCP